MRSPRFLLLAVAIGAALVPAVAAGQVTPVPMAAPAPADTITVTGVRSSPEIVHQRATAFVRATGVAFGEVPVARWAEAVCPHAIGLTDPAAAALVEAKVRSVAAAAGIAAAPASCATNIAIAFVADGAAAVREHARRAPRDFGVLRPAEVAALSEGTAPVRWWHDSEVRDKDTLVGRTTATPRLVGEGFSQRQDGEPGVIQHYSNSLISTGDVRVLRAATVVVDVTRTDGLPLSAVASYAAMVALAEIRPGTAPSDSVLGLFSGGPVMRSPTAWDIAFLRALYRLPLDRTALHQRGVLISELVAAAR